MKNSIGRLIYHWFVKNFYGIKSYRGGWLLTHYYLDDYKKHYTSYWNIIKVHLKGWCYYDWITIGITDNNRMKYLCTKDYHSLHPFNGIYSYYIDDKLTLKYILNGTQCGQYMPDYYYCIESNGTYDPLMDLPSDIRCKNNLIDGILNLCKSKEALAFKAIKGACGQGFYKLEYKQNRFFLNGEELSEVETVSFVKSLKGYLVTELLYPHREIAKYCDKSVGSLRYTIGKKMNGDWVKVCTIMRFGTNESNAVDNFHAGGVTVNLEDDGSYNGGYKLDLKTWNTIKLTNHPDNNIPISGKLPLWDEVELAAKRLTEVLSQNVYLGIDFCLTKDNKVKIIEINSQSGLEIMQLVKSAYDTPAADFFRERLDNLQH